MEKYLWKRGKAVLVTAVLLALSASVPASAGVWKNGEDDPESWWYDHQNGTWAVGWELIDGNGDGIGEWYLFDEDGWLITDYLTKDGYEVDANGAWIQNGAVVHVRTAAEQLPAAARHPRAEQGVPETAGRHRLPRTYPRESTAWTA